MLFHECDNRMWRLGPRDLQDGIRIDGGSDWMCLTREFTRYLTGPEDLLLAGLKAYWKYALLPGEVSFNCHLIWMLLEVHVLFVFDIVVCCLLFSNN